jgi:uncharacterized protein
MSGINLVESPLDPAKAVYREVVPAGEPWLHTLREGQTLRILDLEGNQAVDTLFYSLERPTVERYSAIDTLAAQGNVYLTAGTQLMSNEGNVMLTITADTCGRHDTLGGACATESNTVRYDLEKRPCTPVVTASCSRWRGEPEFGIASATSASNINFFMNVPVTGDGRPDLRGRDLGAGQVRRAARRTDVWCWSRTARS